MTNTHTKTHSNDEPIRKCPYCDWEGASRGLTFHVLNSTGEDHGEKYDLPEDFDASEAEIVGYEKVEVEMPEKYEISDRTRYVCDYCGKICQGEGGLNSHLSHMVGDGVHPKEAQQREASSFPQFKVNDEGDLVAQGDDSLTVATGGAIGDEGAFLEEQEVVPIEDLKALRDAFTDEKTISPSEAAERVQELIDKHQ